MPFNFQFRHAEERKEIDQLSRFLLLQPLGYPNYGDCVERARTELLSGGKSCILAFSDGVLVGDALYQKHKQFPRVREVKNMRVHSKLQGRYFGVFMLKQAEAENPQDYDAVITDIRSDNLSVLNMARFCGYEELLRTPLYERNAQEVVMIKKFSRTPSGLFGPMKKRLVSHSY